MRLRWPVVSVWVRWRYRVSAWFANRTMRGRVSGDLHCGGQAVVAGELSCRAAVALMGVDADHLDGFGPPPGLLGHPFAQVGGVSAVEDVDDLAGGGVDCGGDEPAAPSAGC